MTLHAKIVRWGRSAAIRLGNETLREARLSVGEYVVIDVTPSGLFIKAATQPARPTLNDMIAACDPDAPMPFDLVEWS